MNNLIFTGLLANRTSLQPGKKGSYLSFEVHADDGTDHSLKVFIFGQLATQFDTYNATPRTPLRVFCSVSIRETENEGMKTRFNEISCNKIEMLNDEGKVLFTCLNF